MSSRHPSPRHRRRTAALAAAAALLVGAPALAQQQLGVSPGLTPDRSPAGGRLGAPLVQPAAPAGVARIVVEVQRNALPADGQSATQVTVNLYGPDGRPLAAEVMLTVETSGGRLRLPGAQTDELGPGRGDADPTTPGTQIRLRPGQAGETRFWLLAPDTPQDVLLRVSAGSAQAEGVVSFVPEARGLIAVGLVEGVIRLNQRDPQLIQPVRLQDGFEAELRRFSRSFADGKGEAAARSALFLKGKVLGSTLLTASWDSEKETRARLLRDIKPDEFYPVYGDASIKGFEARSSSRLYLRVDQHKSYALFGDFNTAEGFVAEVGQAAGVAPQPARSLGAYSRTLTGLRFQWHSAGVADPAPTGFFRGGSLGGFAAYDTLKQVTEEFRASGTSGPFVLRNQSALENSEKLEIIVRHKDNPGLIKQQQPLLRLDDYSFEPFTGRILLNRPLASVDAAGDPVSLRVSYEVDQGGERFWVAGAEAGLWLGGAVHLGAAVVEDRNPASPFRLASLFASARLAERTWLTAELAHAASTLYEAGGALFTNPTGQAGEQRQDRRGAAARVALQHQGERSTLEAAVATTQTGFANPGAPLQAGRSEASVKGSWRVSDTVQLLGEAAAAEDRASGGERQGAAVGVGVQLGDRLNVQAGVRVLQENAAFNASSSALNSQLNPNVTPNAVPGSLLAPTGGLMGGQDALIVNPDTGRTLPTYAAVGQQATTGPGIQVDATTVFLGAQYAATERLTLEALLEAAVDGGSRHRGVLASAWRLGERSRLIARYEDQSGLTSAYGATRSNVLSLGADTDYMAGGRLFSEYRLRDANGRDTFWATGLRNSWSLAEGVTATTAAEYLRVLDGLGGDAAAVALGWDHTASARWKLGTKLEWRRVFDNAALPGDDTHDSVLSTVALARKLDRDWTLLARNYLLASRFAQAPGGGGAYTALQDRFQLGVAYRPVDHNRLDVLAKLEFKHSENADQRVGLTESVQIAAVQANWHPSRPWWVSGRLAAKSRSEEGLVAGGGRTRYHAALVSGRLVYDLTENVDIGLMAATLMGSPGGDITRTRQHALGLEVGVLLKQNLWLSAGYNWRGFSDADLTGGEYTNSGAYLRLRFKFDEDLFAQASRAVNRALDRATGGARE